MCGRPAGQAHHIKGVGFLSGAGLKADDSLVIPVCADHHGMFHDGKDRELIDKQWEFAARTLQQAFRSGIISC
jgi:predicted HNH restriction endonuclease